MYSANANCIGEDTVNTMNWWTLRSSALSWRGAQQ
ncbi:Uncharacterised protein [Bordetella pertussis]|nr:Uncharacterised protein [Bordetella pertussis]CFO75875.1 Uncharacterised protein [Bordetella pertussis]CPI21993.1 Uncharacterised protein [Bordetella pertussis]CPM04704.1 Uncharacterised protein [Bordetella pertussis]CPN72195.1 Uncharacterised protein [Bordetella pertussis]